jgi:YVTN family beta-propeller protein
MRKVILLLAAALLSAEGLWAQSLLLPVGSGPFSTEVNLQTNIALIINRNNNSVQIMDLADNTLKKDASGNVIKITVGTGPISAAINPTTNRAVVANFGSDNVSILDLSANTVVATVAVGKSPRAVAIDTTHNLAIVANLNGNSISLVDLNSNTSILPQPIAVGANPIAVAYNPEKNQALVANYTGNSVSVVDLTAKVLATNISTGLAPVSIALNLGTKQAIVANQDTNDISIINLTDNSIVSGSVAVGTRPFAVDVNTTTNIAAVLLNGNRSIALVDLNAATPVKFNTVISNVGENPTGLSVNSSNNTAIVTNPTTDSIYVVPLAFLNYLPFAFDTGEVRDNLGINNLSSTEANVQISLIDSGGTVLKTASVKVPSRALKHITKINQALFGTSSPTNTRGSIKLMSDQPISSFLSIIDYGSSDASIELGRLTGYPKLVINAATNVAPYRSQLVLLNLGNTTAAVTITVYDNSTGAVLTTKTGISIPLGGFYYSDNILTDLGLSAKFGPMQIESPNLQPLIGVTILSNSNGTNGLFEAVPVQ